MTNYKNFKAQFIHLIIFGKSLENFNKIIKKAKKLSKYKQERRE